MAVKAIVIDDETNCVEMMEWLIQTYCPELEIVGMYNNGEEAISGIREHNPDLVFLDIEMPGMNGFQLLENFDKLTFDVVFTTAYNKFAIKAFKYSALNYLLKPVDPEDLQATVKRHLEKRTSISRDQIEMVVNSFIQQNS
ncbi:MAG: hypothetical protein RL220_1386, partial [Bacteroidota bacterium]